MLLFFKRLMLVVTAALLTHSAFGFALLGPRDTWQTSVLGYDPQADGGDLGGPKNLGEEWRWTIPTITYAYDFSFLDYFGTNGVQAIEDAIFLFNREMHNFDALTDDQLRAKPLDTKRIHQTAQALGILDLKSYTMGLLAEQLGMASAERWTWALRASVPVGGGTATNYLVIKRNFDPFTLKPSSYVNGRRLTYRIGVFPATTAANYEDAVEIPIDQAGDGPFMGSTVSAMVGEDLTGVGLRPGEYFSALTQDDIGGLRYIYRQRNVNSEFFPAGTLRDTAAPAIRRVDTNTIIFVQGIDAFSFFSNAFSTNATALLSQFTNLNILSTNIYLTNIVSTQFVITNLATGGPEVHYELPTLISNQDLFLFSERSRTNDAATLRAFYPGLIITRTNSGFERVITETFSLTNAPWLAAGDIGVVTNFSTNLIVTYRYEYANVITNYASAVTDLQLFEVGRAPYSNPNDFLLVTNLTTVRVPKVSGGFYILDRSTNAALISYKLYDQFNQPLLRVTNILTTTNLTLQFTNPLDPGDVRALTIGNAFTNVVYAAYPVLLNAGGESQTVAVLTTNTLVRYNYTFGTNLLVIPPSNGNTNAILETITFTNGGPLRITRSNVFTGLPSGTVLIIDTNSYVLTGQRIENFTLVTNTIISFTNAVTGEFITQNLIYQSNSVVFLANPIIFETPAGPSLRPGVDTIQFVRHPFNDYLDQSGFIATRTYTISAITNGVRYFQTLQRTAGPDIVFAAADLDVTTGAFPNTATRAVIWQTGPNTTASGTGVQINGGPGQIVGGTTITFTKLAPSYFQQNPGLLTEEDAFLALAWGSFDSRTITPRVYPEDITGQLQTLEQLLRLRNAP